MHSLRSVQLIPCTLASAWDFFSSPDNLREITPPYMDFRVIRRENATNPEVHENPEFDHKMYPGQLIEYKIRPVLGIPVYWMTEITHVAFQQYFVDEQRFGPYRFWHHQHHFREISGGVEMTDIVHYSNPLGILGRWANTLFIRRQLEGIFAFRYQRVNEIFGIF